MAISLIVDGYRYEGWTSVNVKKDLMEVSGEFHFELASDKSESLPIRRMAECAVEVNGTPVISGYIDKLEVSYSADSHTISVTGRDKIADVVDSTLSHNIEFKGTTTLEEVISRTFSDIQADGIGVTNEAGSIKPFQKDELISAKIGDGAYQFIDKYARKRLVLIVSDGKGNIKVIKPNEGAPTGTILSDPARPQDSNIKSASLSIDDSQRFDEYAFFSQGNPGSKQAKKPSKGDSDVADLIKDAEDAEEDDFPQEDESEGTSSKGGTGYTKNIIALKSGTWLDSKVRSSRKLRQMADTSSGGPSLAEQAKWEGTARVAQSRTYTAVVVGHGPQGLSGSPFELNMSLRVLDVFCGIDEAMIIKTLEFNYDVDSGSTSTLGMVSAEDFITSLQSADRTNNGTQKAKDRKNGDGRTIVEDGDVIDWENRQVIDPKTRERR